MARSRNIKPGFYKNEELAECSVWARLIFPGLWMLADREGRLEDRPKRIKAELLPFDSVDVEPLLAELAARGFLVRYQNEGGNFIEIANFKKHQTPHYTEKKSGIKPPELQESTSHEEDKTLGVHQEQSKTESGIKRGALPPDSLNPDSLNPEEEGTQARTARRASRLPSDFEVSQEWRDWALETQPTWTPAHAQMVADKFVDYWRSKGGAAAAKLDWLATWRNWVRNEGPMKQFGRGAAPGDDGRRFTINGHTYTVLPNLNGERDNEHVAMAHELGISTRGLERKVLEQKLIGKLRQLAA